MVQLYAPFFASVFSSKALQLFLRYINGLIVSENQTVDGINRLLVLDINNQSGLNRYLAASPFSVGAVSQARLTLLQGLPGTQTKAKGVLNPGDTLSV